MATQLLLEILSCTEPGALATIVSAISPSDWPTLVEEAAFHEVEALLHSHLSALLPAASIPEQPRRDLQDHHAIQSLRNRLLYQELGTVISELQSAGVRAIVLKGAHLAACVYPDAALRSMSDIDLLVREPDLNRTRERLEHLGYSRGKDWKLDYHLPAFRKTNATTIEVHWNIERPSARFAIDIDGLWKRAIPVEIGGRSAWALSAEDLLIHLCLHTAYHHKFGVHTPEGLSIKHLYDVVAVLQHARKEFDWDQLARRANEWRAGKFVYCTLALVERLLQFSIPPGVLAQLRPDDRDNNIVEVVADNILHRAALDTKGFQRWSQHEGLSNRLRFIRRALFPPLESVAAMYGRKPGAASVYFFALLRPFDVAGRNLWSALHLMLHTRRGRLAAGRDSAAKDIEAWRQSS
jgi:hypothetical protein